MSGLNGLLERLFSTDDPYPVYDSMRELGRVLWDGDHGRWLITGHPETAALLSHSKVSSNRRLFEPEPEPAQAAGGFRPEGLPFIDPPDHTRLRSLVQQAFSPRAVAQVTTDVTDLTDELLTAAEQRGGLDLITDLAGPLPAVVFARMLGIPAEHQEQFRAWAMKVIETIDPVSMRLISDEGDQASAELAGYLTGIIAERRRQPADDLISAMIRAEESGRRLTGDELLQMCLLLVIVGLETTTNLIGNGVNALLENPGQLARLHADPALIRTAIEELLRYDPPVQLAGRIVVDDFELGGQTLRRGQIAGVILGAANRDPETFADPGRLDLTRSPNNHLAFGRGIHYCLGAPLARLEAPIVIGALVARFPGLHWAGVAKRRQNVHVRGFESLPLAVA